MLVWPMRTGISITLRPGDRRRLKALARDRNAPQKHVWRARIVLLSADGVGTNEIMRETGKSKARMILQATQRVQGTASLTESDTRQHCRAIAG